MVTCSSQNIPSSLNTLYSAALAPALQSGYARKRYPWRLFGFEKGGSRVSPLQDSHRLTFLEAVASFKALPWTDRQALYSDPDCIASGLWYYNYYIQQFLLGSPWAPMAGIIKQIGYLEITFEHTGDRTLDVDLPFTVDPAKCLVFGTAAMLNFEDTWSQAQVVYPVTVYEDYMIIARSGDIYYDYRSGWTIIEFL